MEKAGLVRVRQMLSDNDPVVVKIVSNKITFMEAQQVFYIVATVVLAILGTVLIALMFLLYKAFGLLRYSSEKLNDASRHIGEYISSMSRTWGTMTAAGIVAAALRKLFRR
jgi:hypothetical protein